MKIKERAYIKKIDLNSSKMINCRVFDWGVKKKSENSEISKIARRGQKRAAHTNRAKCKNTE